MPRRRRLTRYGLWFAVIGVAAAIACYVVGLAWWQSRRHRFYEFDDLLIPRSIDVVIVLWLLWIGSSIGSFLNVVAWRMPRGESLNGRSRCPRCETRLKARDNFPVFGWLALGGRCRTCRLPISPRYPVVEAAVGLSIAVVGVAELYRLALPYQTNHWHGGPLWTPVIDREMLLILLYHVVLLSTSWACGLIRFDVQKLPRSLVVFGVVVAILPMLVYPPLMVVPWQAETPAAWPPIEPWIGQSLYMDAVMRIITAVAVATFLGRLLGQTLCSAADPKLDPLGRDTARLMDLLLMIAVPTVVVGWQSAPALLLLAAVVAIALRSIGRIQKNQLGQLAISLPIALTIHLVAWRKLHESAYWPSTDSQPWLILAYSAALLLAREWLRDRTETDPSATIVAEDSATHSESDSS